MKIKNLAVAIFLLCALSVTVTAERMYILYDPGCMDRVEYDMLHNDGKTDYQTYHVNIRAGEKLILEVGAETDNQQNYLPDNYLSCRTGGFDEALMRRINSNIDEVFIIIPRGDRYRISPVTMAAFYQKQGPQMIYRSPKYSFRFNADNAIIGENIALDNPGVNLYFEGLEQNLCQGAYLFRQLAPQSAYPVIDIKLLPELGIIEERLGTNNAMGGTTLTFEDINEVKLDRFLQDNCGLEPAARRSIAGSTAGLTPQAQAQPQQYDQQFNPPVNRSDLLLPPGAQILSPQYADQSTTLQPRGDQLLPQPGSSATTTPQTTPAPQTAAAPTNQAGVHTVAKGETLYGISRQYSVTVQQIQEWNNLGSTNIRVGQQLRVSTPTIGGGATVTQRGTIANANPGSSLPVPYDQPGAATTTGPNPNATVHIVKSGETIASLALKYGYTENRFRQMNDLGANDYIKVGQRLYTSDCVCPEVGLQNQPAGTGGTVRPQVTDQAALNARTSVPNTAMSPQTSTTTPGSTVTSRGIIPGGTPVTSQPYPGTQAQPGYSQPGYSTQPGYNAQQSYSTQPGYNTQQTYYPPNSYDQQQPAITNEPQFGSIIPDAYDYTPGGTSMSALESGSTTINPRDTYNNSGYGTPLPGAGDNQYNQPQDSRGLPAGAYNNTNTQPQQYSSTVPGANRRVHIVQEGENMYSISRRYGLSTEQLARLNGMTAGEVIIPYQRLYIE